MDATFKVLVLLVSGAKVPPDSVRTCGARNPWSLIFKLRDKGWTVLRMGIGNAGFYYIPATCPKLRALHAEMVANGELYGKWGAE